MRGTRLDRNSAGALDVVAGTFSMFWLGQRAPA